MPLTYLSHQAAVLPLKMWRPTWFDGTALVFGSMAPDWAYVFNRSRFYFDAHVWPAALWFAVPVSVAATLVVRRQEPSLLAAMPWHPRWLQQLARRRPVSRPLVAVVACAALGVLTHIVWDSFTHDFRWGAQHVGWLREQVTLGGRTMSHAHLLQQISTVGGAVVTVVLLAVMGRRESLLGWRPEPRPAPAPRVDWRVLAVTAGAAILGMLWASGAHDDVAAAVNRLVLTTAAGYAAAAVMFIRKDSTEAPHAHQS